MQAHGYRGWPYAVAVEDCEHRWENARSWADGTIQVMCSRCGQLWKLGETPADPKAIKLAANRLGAELENLVGLYRTCHPEVIETIGRRIGNMSEGHRLELLVLAVAVLADGAPYQIDR